MSENEENPTAFWESIPDTEEEQMMLSQIMIIENKLIEFYEYQRFMEGFRLGPSTAKCT